MVIKTGAIKGEPHPDGEFYRFERELGGDSTELNQRGEKLVFTIRFSSIKAAAEAMSLLKDNIRMHGYLIIKFPT